MSAPVKIATPNVELISKTEFIPPASVPFTTDALGGPAAIEFAGRACYQSWTKPNPATATNGGYIRHILEVGHLSVLEHGSAGFYLTGVSRTLTHELIRHRHLSPSQLSQRYVDSSNAAVVEPDIIADDPELHELFLQATGAATGFYTAIRDRLDEKLAARYEGTNASKTSLVKAARQAARSVLPNATETRLVMTGNFRSWRHFLNLRATEHADVEIRALAIDILAELRFHFPTVFSDYAETELADGTVVAASPFGAAA